MGENECFSRATVSDEDEEYTTTRVRSKWSTPTVQKQRLAYMDNLTSKVRSRGTYETDQFNERSITLHVYFQEKAFFLDDGIKRVMISNPM